MWTPCNSRACGNIRKLNLEMIENDSIDVIISNCVINLCPDKRVVLEEIFKVLKFGGEFYFSDVYSNRRIPEELKKDEVLWGECLSGALYWNDFLNLSKECGFNDIRLVKSNKIEINNRNFVELLYRFEFPERPGALINFLNNMKSNWSISVFHYRNYGADVGKIVIGVLIDKSEITEWDKFVKISGYKYWDETKNNTYKLFLGATQ